MVGYACAGPLYFYKIVSKILIKFIFSFRRSSNSGSTLVFVLPIVNKTVNKEYYNINSDKPLDNN